MSSVGHHVGREIEQVGGLLAEIGISREELDSKINRQLEIDDGIDALEL